MTRGAAESSGRGPVGVLRWAGRLAVVGAAITVAALPAAAGWAAMSPQTAVPPVRAAGDNPVAPDANGALPAGWKNTQWGPVGPADINLLESVRRADIWEGEGAAVMGMQKGNGEKVRDAAEVLYNQHQQLEAALKPLAAKLQVTLPTQPNADQQTWLGEMSAATGEAFDQVWVDRLRAAHGKIFSLIATVRANTRNSLVRDFATTGNTIVTNHMRVLEATGLVKYNDLPTPANPTTTPPGYNKAANVSGGGGSLLQTQSSASGGLNPMIIGVVLIAACAAGGMVAVRVLRGR